MNAPYLDWLKYLVEIPSVNDRHENLQPDDKIPKFLYEFFIERQFKTEIIEQNGYYSVLAIKGDHGPKILFLAHFDVVPPGNGWQTDPFKLTIKGEKAFGRGTIDDKGNVVALMLLAEKLKDLNLDATIMIGITGDEEIGGRNGSVAVRERLRELGLSPEYVIVADGSGQRIIFRRRNTFRLSISARSQLKTIRGITKTIRFETEYYKSQSRHSAYFRPGLDRHALLCASRFVLENTVYIKSLKGDFIKENVVPSWVELEVVYPDPQGTDQSIDMTLTNLVKWLYSLSRMNFPSEPSDYGTNILPNMMFHDGDIWSVNFDIRAMSNDKKSIHRAAEKVLEGRLSYSKLEVLAGVGYVSNSLDSKLIKAAVSQSQEMNWNSEPIEGAGASDSRHFADGVTQIFDFGPLGTNLHGPNEYVLYESIPETTEFYFGLIKRLI